jgi:hypothetical protein
MGGEPNRGPMMTRVCWRLVDILSRMLEVEERQAVRGDLAESGESIGRALRDVLGLIVRRQIGLWTEWQPWLALLGVACLAGVPLSRTLFRFNVDLAQQLMAYEQYGVHFGTLLTPQQDMAFLLCLHQLSASVALCEELGVDISRCRLCSARRPHAGVFVRARTGERGKCRAHFERYFSGRHRQQVWDLAIVQ